MMMLNSYIKASKDLIFNGMCKRHKLSCVLNYYLRYYGNDNSQKHEFINSTILVEDGINVRELPLVVRKIRNLDYQNKSLPEASNDSCKYHLIQAEFRQCSDLRAIFSLLSKCTKITPNIALGAMERICDIEKNTDMSMLVDTHLFNAHLAKGAILEKLLKVVMQTEDSQTLINALNVDSNVLEPYKYDFCDELLLRVIENKLPLQQLIKFLIFLNKNRKDQKYEETIDKLWVGFVERQDEVNEKNFIDLLNIVCYLKTSKSIVCFQLEKKLWTFWWKLSVRDMLEMLNIFSLGNSLTLQSLSIVGRWLNTNIHKLDEDSLLDFIIKITRLQYTDQQIENAIERYLKAKINKICSQVLIVTILNYCLTFRICNKNILNSCSKYFISNFNSISPSFLRSFIFPYGYLYFNPENRKEFWCKVEYVLQENFSKLPREDILSILLSFLYLGNHPLKFIDMIYDSYFLDKISPDNVKILQQQLNLIDSILTLECKTYSSRILEKSMQPSPQDIRLKKIIKEIYSTVVTLTQGDYRVSSCVPLPGICSDGLYIIDFLLHADNVDINNLNCIMESEKNKTIAVLIHLPEHYCLNSNRLIGPQIMRKKHLQLLNMKVISLSYAMVCKLQPDKTYLERYIRSYLEN